MSIMAGMATRRICTSPYLSPYPVEKVRDFPYSYHPQLIQRFFVKTKTDSNNIHESSLFIIPNKNTSLRY